MLGVIIMKKYTPEEREAAIKELEAAELKPEEWEGPHETKVKCFRFVDDRIKAALHTA